MNSICFFSSHFNHRQIPYYVKRYLTELSLHFNEVVLITSCANLVEADLGFLSENKIGFMPVENEGFDFGMWKKAFEKHDVTRYDRVGLVNDSCVLFKSLDYVFETINKNDWDYCGILDSHQIAYHIQSFFVVINKPALDLVSRYFKEHGLMSEFNEVIKIYEVGLTQHLLANKLKAGSVYSYEVSGKLYNPSFSGIEKLIRSGFPMIKRKIIFGNYRKGELKHLGKINFNLNPGHYIRLIKANCKDLLVDFAEIKKDYSYTKISGKLFSYSVFFNTIKELRKIKRKMLNRK